jgi:hypothetical protein
MTLTVRSASVTGATTAARALTHAEMDANWAHVIESSNQNFTPSGTGASARSVQAKLREFPSLTDFEDSSGNPAGTSATAATNTAALNRALAAHSVVFIPGGPGDVYDLNALDSITASKILFGNGATLRFNTTSDCISLSATHPGNQNKVARIIGLAFDNVTNTPSSFIKNDGFLNVLLEDLQFSDCAATYCVDNVWGYGTTLRSCVFSDVTGACVRLRDDGATNEYSYVYKIEDCDFTRPSGNAIECEGTAILKVSGSVIQGCGGKGIVTATAGAASIQGWNVTLTSTYFENNTGTDIDLSTDGNNYWSHATLIGCYLVGTPTIALGTKSKVAIIGCHNSGGHACTVSGSDSAQAFLANSFNFTQSGTFDWIDATVMGNYSANTSYTPTFNTANADGSIGDGTITGFYTRVGDLVTASVRFVAGSTTDFGSGALRFGLPFTAATKSNHIDWGVGRITDATTQIYSTMVAVTNATAYATLAVGVNATAATATSPMTWVSTDSLEFSVTYTAA